MLAAVLAHVRDDDPKKTRIATAIGSPRAGEGSTALITPLRFKRLITARDPEDLLIVFRRAVAILGRRANVKDLARALLTFTDNRLGVVARTRFAFEYHGAGDAAPEMKDAETAA